MALGCRGVPTRVPSVCAAALGRALSRGQIPFQLADWGSFWHQPFLWPHPCTRWGLRPLSCPLSLDRHQTVTVSSQKPRPNPPLGKAPGCRTGQGLRSGDPRGHPHPSARRRVEVRGHPRQVGALPGRLRPARRGPRFRPLAGGEERGAPGQAGQGGSLGGRGRGRGFHRRGPGAGPQSRGGCCPALGSPRTAGPCPVPTAPLCRWLLPSPGVRRVLEVPSLGTRWGPAPCWLLPGGISARHGAGPRECRDGDTPWGEHPVPRRSPRPSFS